MDYTIKNDEGEDILVESGSETKASMTEAAKRLVEYLNRSKKESENE